ncbi:hypothetical protein [Candidatus Villigracilis affinis]|uniref:hypothetical protein n=1 Tax=Candidatus Villigracilis affinis TaxID=3140682 RepID=UPI002A1E74ED|nr:hypothetical protein [Anaerolineales bacterium]
MLYLARLFALCLFFFRKPPFQRKEAGLPVKAASSIPDTRGWGKVEKPLFYPALELTASLVTSSKNDRSSPWK